MVDELEEKPGEGINLQQYVHYLLSAYVFLDTFFPRLARGLERELGFTLGLQVGYAHPGRTTEHAEILRDSERNRRFAGTLAKHHPADSQPNQSFAHYR